MTLRMTALCLPALALLGACATPQERCINDATREMNIVSQLIAQTQGNLQRGFALQEETVYRSDFEDCTPAPTKAHPNPKPRLCPVQVPETTTKAVAIDLTAENAKLTSLEKKRAQQKKVADAAIKQCRAVYPE
ncbi:MAG: hypothetical protein U5N55_06265 [Cypionkella sp.]|nr:hypothetical protein [Cypionkella sp.]